MQPIEAVCIDIRCISLITIFRLRRTRALRAYCGIQRILICVLKRLVMVIANYKYMLHSFPRHILRKKYFI